MKRTLLIISACLLSASMVNAGPKCEAAKTFLEDKKDVIEAHKGKHKGTKHSRLKKLVSSLQKAAESGKDDKKCEKLHKRIEKKLKRMEKGAPVAGPVKEENE